MKNSQNTTTSKTQQGNKAGKQDLEQQTTGNIFLFV